MQFKGLLLNLGSSYAHIILSVLLNILYVPISLHYMGAERYGVWVVLQTLINYLTLANFGIPTAVTNLMSQANNDVEQAEILLKGFKILYKICLLVFALSAITYCAINYFSPWLDNLSEEIKIASIILITFFIFRIPFQIATSAFIAKKKIFISKIYDLAVIAITFLSLLVTIYFKQNLIFLALISGVLLLGLQVCSFLNALYMLKYKRQLSIETISNKEIYRPGLSLFAAGLGSLVIWNTDNIIISKFLGFEEVAIYSSAFRLFSFGYMSFGLIYGILIPYYGNYFKLKIWHKLENLFNFSLMIIPFLGACVWLVGWFFSKEIIILWLGSEKLYGGSTLYFLLGAYGLCLSFVGVMFNLLTSLNQLKSLFYLTIGEATINLVASILLVKIFGADGVAAGTLLASTVVPLLVLPFLIDKNKKLEFPFAFKKLLNSIFFYTIVTSVLFYAKLDLLQFQVKLLIAFFALLIFALFQYIINKGEIYEAYQIAKAKRNN